MAPRRRAQAVYRCACPAPSCPFLFGLVLDGCSSDDEEALQDVPMIIPFEDLPQLEAAGLISHSSVLQTKAAARSHWKLKHDPDLVPDVLAAERRKRTAEEKRAQDAKRRRLERAQKAVNMDYITEQEYQKLLKDFPPPQRIMGQPQTEVEHKEAVKRHEKALRLQATELARTIRMKRLAAHEAKELRDRVAREMGKEQQDRDANAMVAAAFYPSLDEMLDAVGWN